MSRTEFMRRLVIVLPYLLVASALVFTLTATYLRNVPLPWHWMEVIRMEVMAACEHPDAQRMTVALAALYFFGFAALRWLQVRSHADKFRARIRLVLVVVLAGWAIISYALNYHTAAGTTDLLVLLIALAAGQAVAFWLGWAILAGRSVAELRLKLLRLLALLLALASLFHPVASREFQYRGQIRWAGLWENPNSFGVLMAVGFVLNLGLLIHSCSGLSAAEKGSGWNGRWRDHCSSTIWILSSVATGIGLIFSYCRGAWLGAALGLGWLGWSTLRSATEPPSPPRLRLLLFRRCAPPLVLLALSLGVIAFWSLRHTEIPLLRRVFTVGNPNDFSWRNRVATWPGALQVMARKPITGWGWNRPVSVYEHGQQPTWLSESAAITLNDYLMLGMTLGVPVLWAFLLWIWLAWQPATVDMPSTLNSQLSTCHLPHAALLPLLLGFALDGGLFKLAVAVPFMTLLEMVLNPSEG